jgi:hypothetical protein
VASLAGLLIDNTRVGEGGASGFTQWGTTIGVQLPQLAPSWSAGTWLSIVNSLAYRSRIGLPEYYMLDNIGLARDKTDVVLVHAEAEWFGPHGLILKPTLDFMWKGEANLTDRRRRREDHPPRPRRPLELRLGQQAAVDS